ncbi:uncharacterized protein F5Z01DRAFT_675702 [Emericellopsis atlantica]|uniref:Uncharacterized protein n=1 Tax=Emericellopsis atlantica TaxID=2614577 RepID=A0A9P8CMP5_9HYPO|nr:uncharacterized protein F5Z01DRAFT_675702 [Emericellopsis atlantica]KAG9252914.1 hypothetical protein F5Z01DRAFT_675702 [Emericellopsis atlantica]
MAFIVKSPKNGSPPASGSNNNWTRVKKYNERLQRWQRQTHQGSKISMNVWILPRLDTNDPKSSVNNLVRKTAIRAWSLTWARAPQQYALFPKDADEWGKLDGIVME